MTALRDAVGRYIRAKVVMTHCRQKHMRQVCHVCSNYTICPVYGAYVEAWVRLQRVYKGTGK